MDIQTQKQPECDKKESVNESKPLSNSEKLQQGLYRALKRGLVMVMLKPSTWRWMMVNLPHYAEKAELTIRNVIDFLTGFIS